MHPFLRHLSSIRRSGAALLALTAVRALLAVSATENQLGDFPNSADTVGTGFTFSVAAGANTFSGTVPFASGDADFFKITVPVGVIVTGIQTTSGLGFTLPGPFPLTPGTYTIAAGTGLTLSDNNWALTVTGANADYTVTTTGGKIVVTDRGGRAETLAVTQTTAGTIRFSAAGRFFTVDGGAGINGTTGDIALNSITALEITLGAGGDTLDFGGFPGTTLPQTEIITAPGGESAVFNFIGDCTFGGTGLSVGRSAVITAIPNRINIAAGARIQAAGTGSIVLTAGRSLSVLSGALVSTAEGDAYLYANATAAGGSSLSGNFTGILIAGGTVQSGGTLYIYGQGGDDPNGYQLGVNITDGGKVIGGVRRLLVDGVGGPSTGIVNRGITVYGTGSAITFGPGGGSITGTAGAKGGGFGIGIAVLFGGEIVNNSAGQITISGDGGGAPGSGFNQGIELGGSGSRIVNTGGPVQFYATAGPGASTGLYVSGGAAASFIAPIKQAIVQVDSLFIDTQSAVVLSSSTGRTTLLVPFARSLDLGGESTSATLGLSAANLARISGGSFTILSGPVTNIISRPVVLTCNLVLSSSFPGAINPDAAGTDIDLGSGTLTLDTHLAIAIRGTAPDTQHSRLKVVGRVAIDAASSLSLTDVTHVGALGDTFTIIDNDGTDPISGVFANLPEGATFPWPADPRRSARISYFGGDGNDAVLTLVEHPPFVVSNTNDSGAGSLRDAIAAAIARPGDDRIVLLDSSLDHAPISLNSPLSLTSGDDLITIDASALSRGPHITRAPHSGSVGEIADVSGRARFVDVTFGSAGGPQSVGGALNVTGYAEFENCTFADNNAFFGGAIYSTGTLKILRCTFANNSALRGGAIYQAGGGPVSIDRCTFVGNHATQEGGAIFLQTGSTALLVHCTVTGNNTGGSAGGIFVATSTLTLGNSIVSSDQFFGIDVLLDGASTLTTRGVNIVGLPHTNPAATISGTPLIIATPRLGGFGSNGGRTSTVPTLPGSPARDAATPDTTTSDQRGFAYVGVPDIGAYESGAFTDFFGWGLETFPVAHLANENPYFADYDADGAPDLLEYALLTDPLQSRASDALPLVTRVPGGLRIEFAARIVADLAAINLERSTDLLTWSVVASVDGTSGVATIVVPSLTATTPGAPGRHAFLATAAGDIPRAFYRLKVTRR